MKSYPVIFALFITLLGIVVTILLQSAPGSVSGNPHPSFPSMSQGGDASRHDGITVLGWLFGALQIILFVVCIWVSLCGVKAHRWMVIACGVAYLFVFTMLMITYRQGVAEAPFVLGFPLPTTLLLFGMWPMAAVFAILYVVKFRSWVYSPQDQEAFENLKAEMSSKGGDHDA